MDNITAFGWVAVTESGTITPISGCITQIPIPAYQIPLSILCFQSDGTGWFVIQPALPISKGTWEQYAVLHGISDNQFNSVYVDYLQRVWICGDNSLLCLIGDSFQNYPRTLFADYSCNFYNAYVDDNQNIWLSFFDTYSPLSLVKIQRYEHYPLPHLRNASAQQYLQAIFEGFDGKLWLGTADSDGIGATFPSTERSGNIWYV
jgi:hypothetical protein